MAGIGSITAFECRTAGNRGGAGRLFVSAISAFEIGVKHRKGKIIFPSDPGTWFRQALRLHGIRPIAVTHRVALVSTALPLLHNDPMDRIIVATARVRKLTVLTPDQHIRQYPEISSAW